ncbi:acyltransferase [Streptomyces sp. PTY087I2]|uniref:acyltransferase family protein n=1 Tax=Streptomyces sp. PTY087I2 TaxID=1819298 RepID=UPI00080BD353|nr:acyltransferase [Streptomyces sp. PTY087I2]OCC07231.1 Acyltransferase family protein [Streptomyces sp. PTY087I2]
MSPDLSRPRLPSLTGIRFPLMLVVFIGHVALIVPFADPEAAQWYRHYLGGIGKVGLSCFFVLGGFILTWIHREKDSPLLFWRRRLAKIVPLHWLTFAVAMVVFAGSVTTFEAGAMSFLLLQAWSPDPQIFGAANAPSWSLTCVVFFYLLFPVLHRAMSRVKVQHLWWCVGAVLAVVFAIPAVVRALVPAEAGMAPNAPAGSTDAFWIIQIFPVTRLLEFVLGILAARIVMAGRWTGPGPLPFAVLLAVLYFAALETPAEYRLVAMTIVPVTLLLGSLAAADLRGDRSIAANRFMEWLGDISFAFLLIHWPVMNFFFQQFGEEFYSVPKAIGVVCLDLSASLALAWLLTVAVERPLVRLLSPKRRSREAARAH